LLLSRGKNSHTTQPRANTTAIHRARSAGSKLPSGGLVCRVHPHVHVSNLIVAPRIQSSTRCAVHGTTNVRTMTGVCRSLEAVTVPSGCGAPSKVLDKAHLDLTTTMGKGLFSAMAQDERERIHKRASAGRKAAKDRGVRLGRKPKLTDHQIKKARERTAAAWRRGREPAP